MIFDKKALLFLTCSAGVFFQAAAATEGKSSKGTKGQNNPVPLYFLNPSSCPQKCAQCAQGFIFQAPGLAAGAPQPVDGHGTGEAVQPCDAENKHQMWRLHQKDGLTMIESYFNPGDCLAVVPPSSSQNVPNAMAGTLNDQSGHGGTLLDHGVLVVGETLTSAMDGTLKFPMTGDASSIFVFTGDDWQDVDMCNHGSVGLLPCNNPEAQWIFNGANLISALCWKNGISSFLTVNEECSELSVVAADGGNDALLRSQMFMLTEQDFIETIVPVSTDEEDPNDSDQMLGGAIRPDLKLPEPVTGTEGLQIAFNDWGYLVGALPEPNDNDEPVVPAECKTPCENGKVCAKHSSTEEAKHSQCYTECSNDVVAGEVCTSAGNECVKGLSSDGIISTMCKCDSDGKNGDAWQCWAY
ncbi:hypothetical protein ACHAWC_001643 [Mediolabrus comicus]